MGLSGPGRVVAVCVGGVETFTAGDGKPLTSGIRKRVVRAARLELLGFPGDASTDAAHHTPDQAVHVFSAEPYPLLEQRLGLSLPRPAFGENLIASGLGEADVCVGDRLRCGAASIEVTQPTERCKAVGRRLGAPRVLKILHELSLCGFYARVIEPGRVGEGDAIALIERPTPSWSIRRLHDLMFHHLDDDGLVAEALALPTLAPQWKRRIGVMRERRRRGEPISSNVVGLDQL